MAFSFLQRRKILKDANYLDLTPVKLHESEIDQTGTVIVIIPKFTNKYAAKILLPLLKTKNFRIKLDELGSAVWNSIDGKTNVANLCIKLHKEIGSKIDPVQERVTKFLTQLYLQGFITFKEIN